jgi:uncharacterized coiled-coil DUF342 family protein
MDEPRLQKIVGIVKEMNSQGLSKNEIEANLRQMGLGEEDIELILKEAKPEINVSEVHDQASRATEMLEKGEHLQPALEKLDQQLEHFERLHSNVGELHEKTGAATTEMGEIKRELEEINETLGELKPMLAAVKRLNEDLIKINQKMLKRLSVE